MPNPTPFDALSSLNEALNGSTPAQPDSIGLIYSKKKSLTPTCKFKVGDKVILNEDIRNFHKGMKMKVISMYYCGNNVFDVQCMYGKKKHTHWFRNHFLTKVIFDKKPGWF